MPEERAPNVEQVTVTDIITRCNEAITRMSPSNPHRTVVINAAFGLRQLCDMLAAKDAEIAELKKKIPKFTLVRGGQDDTT